MVVQRFGNRLEISALYHKFMFKPLFHLRMKERRRQLGLSQSEAAARCEIDPQRWSNLERGERRPSEQEFQVISIYLNLGDVFVPPPAATRKLLNNAARLSPPTPPYFTHQDRVTHIRYCTCAKKYSALVNALMDRIKDREDFPLCEYLCHNISCDSKLEPILMLYLLANGADVGLRSPYLLGHTRWPIFDCEGKHEVGQRPRPCMILDGTWYFFQVSFKISGTYRVDALCWNGSWSVVEINGAGHDSSRDKERAREIGLPTRYWNEQQLIEMVEGGLWKLAS